MVACCWTVTSEDPSKAWWFRCSVGMKLRESWGGLEVSLVIQMVKNLPVMQETQVQSLGWIYFVLCFSCSSQQAKYSNYGSYSVVTTTHGAEEENLGVSA